MKIEFCPLNDSHLNALSVLAQTTLLPVWSAMEYGYFLSHPSSFNWGMFNASSQKLLCFVLALRTAEELDIVSIACSKEEQRKGLAGRLLDHVLEVSGCSRAVLEVDLTNEPAVKLYLKKEFQVVGRRKKYYQGKRDAWIMAWNRST